MFEQISIFFHPELANELIFTKLNLDGYKFFK